MNNYVRYDNMPLGVLYMNTYVRYDNIPLGVVYMNTYVQYDNMPLRGTVHEYLCTVW